MRFRAGGFSNVGLGYWVWGGHPASPTPPRVVLVIFGVPSRGLLHGFCSSGSAHFNFGCQDASLSEGFWQMEAKPLVFVA